MNSLRKWTVRLLSGVIYALPVLLIALAMTAAAPPPGGGGFFPDRDCEWFGIECDSCSDEGDPLPVVGPGPA